MGPLLGRDLWLAGCAVRGLCRVTEPRGESECGGRALALRTATSLKRRY